MSASPPTSSTSSSAAGVPLLSAAPSSTSSSAAGVPLLSAAPSSNYSHGDCTACHFLGRSIPAAAPYSGSQSSLSERARIIQADQVTAALDHEVLDLRGRLDVAQDLLEASVQVFIDPSMIAIWRFNACATKPTVVFEISSGPEHRTDADEVTPSAAASPSNVVPSQLEIALGDLDDIRAELADIKATWTPPPTASVTPGGRLLAASEAATDDDRTSD
ncbi:hypothetical protein PHYSODRAFT_321328 [Phytophthora sojae]|uniref:Cytochrome c domain-containing protein n=1 Tax=Phytophthora sojae (strain P6497) TaxID=1094619 RepID=G4YK25_PHYSP|nr:hypothetical protein PHYSODRAFT_321328 [Phytophthora sojae]EGZ27530.1 hypothetical protein PHYSODRAFT_321328 [Phytophthora sojae]|eukprot:XP_009514805.1 hypothetical protein PHYSODRAFT_321328 [Phytophthora sojae]